MQYWWVVDGEVVGAAIAEVSPGNFQVVEGVECDDRDLVYFDGEAVVFKPEKPSPDAIWSSGDRAWVVPVAPTPTPLVVQNFAGLEATLRNSAVWFRAWNAAKSTVRANAGFTLLLNAIATNHNLNDIRFAFNELRLAMQEQSSLTDFTSQELQFVEQALVSNGFETTGFNLSLP